jgi:uncharacterized protein
LRIAAVTFCLKNQELCAMELKHTLVFGASLREDRYSNAAIHSLLNHGHTVSAVGLRSGTIRDVWVQTGTPAIDGIHTITLYLNPRNQVPYYDYLLGLNPRRIIFNPGTENPELRSLAKARGMEVVYDCTLYMLSLGMY